MKKIMLFIIVVLINCNLNAQDFLKFEEVVQVPDVSADELYLRAKVFITDAFVSANNVIQMDDKDAGIIICKGTMKYEPSIFTGSDLTRGYINFTFKIYLKEGRYKYIFEDFKHTATNSKGYNWGYITTDDLSPVKYQTKNWSNKIWKDIKSQIDNDINYGMRLNLKSTMRKPIDSDGDDW